ncbi:MAG: nucleoside 2-deoxyribosyltransferase [Coprothermobacterota bacterium]|nr:nucleoside 2-deoxyribosyltransferase [Coprothermobacterota bacterium]
MKVYFALPVVAGRTGAVFFLEMLTSLEEKGHQVLTEHLFHLDSLIAERRVPRSQVFARDIHWLEGSDVLIAEVTVPSTGVGCEVAHAISLGKPVLCLAEAGVPVSAMIEGNPALTLSRYRDSVEAIKGVAEWLERLVAAEPNG